MNELEIERVPHAGPRNWRYEDGWAEEEWEKEFDRHPFFMTKSPEPTADLHPLLEGLQQLKYSEEDNTAEELSETYKRDGLFSFDRGEYEDAILNFTAALKYRCSNELKSQLFNSRAASHFFLRNYRSALQDSREAMKLNTNYSEVKRRIALCLFNLGNYHECIEACETILREDKNNPEMLELRNEAVEKKKLQDRDRRKRQKKLKDEEKLIKAIKDRSIRIKVNEEDLFAVGQLDPPTNPPGLERVFLNENSLVWSAVIAFPEPKIFEYVQSFHEDVTFAEILEDIFVAIHEEWDPSKRHTKHTVNVYFKDKHRVPVKIPIESTLLETQQHSRYFQDSGVPQFFIVPKNSEAENEFVADSHR